MRSGIADVYWFEIVDFCVFVRKHLQNFNLFATFHLRSGDPQLRGRVIHIDFTSPALGTAMVRFCCQRMRCGCCGQVMGLFGLEGWGFSRRRHEAACRSFQTEVVAPDLPQPAAPTPTTIAPPVTLLTSRPVEFLPRVDKDASLESLNLITVMKMISVTRDELATIMETNPEVAGQVGLYKTPACVRHIMECPTDCVFQ